MSRKQVTIPELIIAVEEECQRINYGSETSENFKETWEAYKRYAESRGEQYYQEQTASLFLKELFNYPDQEPKSKIARSMIRAMRVLGDYNLFGRILMQKVGRGNQLTTDDFQVALINYEKMCEERKNQKSTFDRRAWIMHHIIEHFIKCGATTCKEINPTHISSYVQSLLGYSKNAVERRLSTLRGFLHSMYLYGLRDDDLSLYVPKLYYPKSAKIPTTLNADELAKIFSAIDRGSPMGKRDYCLILFVKLIPLYDRLITPYAIFNKYLARAGIKHDSTLRLGCIPSGIQKSDAFVTSGRKHCLYSRYSWSRQR